jgi:hypothetical protein
MHITIPQMITNDELEKKISMLSLQSVMPTKPKKKKKKKTNLNLNYGYHLFNLNDPINTTH